MIEGDGEGEAGDVASAARSCFVILALLVALLLVLCVGFVVRRFLTG